jgi:hypothetical protein
LQVAHNNTNHGGEIDMLDPAGRIATDGDRRPRQRSGSSPAKIAGPGGAGSQNERTWSLLGTNREFRAGKRGIPFGTNILTKRRSWRWLLR